MIKNNTTEEQEVPLTINLRCIVCETPLSEGTKRKDDDEFWCEVCFSSGVEAGSGVSK